MLKEWWYGRKGAVQNSFEWIDALIVLSLHAINRGVSVTWYIDRADLLGSALACDIQLNAVLTASLVEFIVHCASLQEPRLLVVRSGLLVGVVLASQEISSSRTWAERYNLVIVQSFSQSRSFTIITAERTWHDIGSYHALQLLKHIIAP